MVLRPRDEVSRAVRGLVRREGGGLDIYGEIGGRICQGGLRQFWVGSFRRLNDVVLAGVAEFHEEALGGADGLVGVELGGWGEEAVVGVDGDLGDDFFGVAGFRLPISFQVEAGDLEAVEEQAGAARVDLVGGDAAEHFADGELDAAALG
jgi:hypothetical protein